MLPEAIKRHLLGLRLTAPLTVKELVALEVKARGLTVFRKWNLMRDVAYGIIGDRGTGKSVTEALIAIRDYAMVLEPVYSNEHIMATLEIDDDLEQTIRDYEEFTGMKIKREAPVYESEPLDVGKLLSPDPPYTGGAIVVDELNIELADAWRSTMNQALATSDFMQLLRKLQSAFVFSCISEMFVPTRVRDAVDVYIATRDMAFVNESSHYGEQQGQHCEWKVYPMTGKLAGYDRAYGVTKQAYETIRVHSKRCWGMIDTWARKQRKKHINSLYGGVQMAQGEQGRELELPELQITPSPKVLSVREEWGWLIDHPLFSRMVETGEELSAQQVVDALADSVPLEYSKDDVLDAIKRYLNPQRRYSGGRLMMSFGRFERARISPVREKVAVPV